MRLPRTGADLLRVAHLRGRSRREAVIESVSLMPMIAIDRRCARRTLARVGLVCAWCAGAVIVAACGGAGNGDGSGGGAQHSDAIVEESQPRDVVLAPLAVAADLDENSAAAASVAQSGVVFSVNDSGHEPELFAFDTTGADRGRWRIQGAMNRDWEAVAVGRCAPAREPWCVYIGDVGDNAQRRPLVTIYRVAEPTPIAAGDAGALRADALVVRYPDGAHNVEAMIVAPDGSLQLFTKEQRRRGRRVVAKTLVYSLAARAWGGATPAEAELVDSLPIAFDVPEFYTVTDAALSADGRLLSLRTPERLFTFRVDSTTARRLPGLPPAICDLSSLREAQGEGVGILHYGARTARVALTSEGSHEPLRLASCPIPPP